MSKQLSTLPADYAVWLGTLKQRIAGARQRVLLSANEVQIRLYHDIGIEILDRQTRQGWGTKVIDRVSADLREAFPDMKGLSSTNLKYMRFFAKECPCLLIGQQSADQLPWFHIVIILTKLSEPELREWYAVEALRNNWPRDTLDVQINTVLHDIKLTDPERHKKWTGVDNTRIRENLKRAYETFPDKTFIARTPLIPGVNDDEEHIRATLAFIKPYKNVVDYELLPYMRFGESKYGFLGKIYEMQDFEPPTPETVKRLRGIIDEAFGRKA